MRVDLERMMRTRHTGSLLLAAILLMSSAWLVAPVAAKKASSIILEVTPRTVIVGVSVGVSVNLTDAATGAGLKSAFRLYYSVDGGNSWNELGTGILGMGRPTTDENGKFSSSWKPSGHLPHDYLLKAYWEGNETYANCTFIQALTVELPTEVPLAVRNVRSVFSGSTLYVVGEIENTGVRNVGDLTVAVGYYDAAGSTVGARISATPLELLKPGEASPFFFERTILTGNISRYEVVVYRFTVTDEEPYVSFEVSGVRSYGGKDDYHVLGLVKNSGSLNAESVNVLAVFYDSSERLLGYGTSPEYRSILAPSERSPFDASGTALEAPDHYRLVVQGKNTTMWPYTGLRIAGESGGVSYGAYRVSGEVGNAGLSYVENVKVIAAFYDANGSLAGCSYALGEPTSLLPGETAGFEVRTYRNVSMIQRYELWADCKENAWWYDVTGRGATWKVFVTSSSQSVEGFVFDRRVRTIRFSVWGYSATPGWCSVVVPNQVLGGPFTVLIDGVGVPHTETQNATHAFLSFTYQHSQHEVAIVGAAGLEREPSAITCSVDPTSARYGDVSTTVSGQISPVVGETKSVPIAIEYSADGISWVSVTTVVSSFEARYEYRWSRALTPGTYYLRARWDGSPMYANATSEKVVFTVTRLGSVISASVSKTSITEGDEITVSGSVQPARGAVEVTLTYRKPDGTDLTRTVTSSSSGAYTDTWKPSPKGSWSVTANSAGSETYDAASSSAVSFTVKEKSACIIATATYGSELSPEVQFLRQFRDGAVLSSFAGSAFMKAFNAFYYSFSPSVADSIRENAWSRDLAKALLYPLMGILHLSSETYSLLSFSPELAVTAAGLLASSLIGFVYLTPPLTVAFTLSERLRRTLTPATVSKPSLVICTLTVILMILSEILASPTLMMVSSASFVLASLSATALISASTLTQLTRGCWKEH